MIVIGNDENLDNESDCMYNIFDYLAKKQQGLVTENMNVPKKHSSRNFRIRTLLS